MRGNRKDCRFMGGEWQGGTGKKEGNENLGQESLLVGGGGASIDCTKANRSIKTHSWGTRCLVFGARKK